MINVFSGTVRLYVPNSSKFIKGVVVVVFTGTVVVVLIVVTVVFVVAIVAVVEFAVVFVVVLVETESLSLGDFVVFKRIIGEVWLMFSSFVAFNLEFSELELFDVKSIVCGLCSKELTYEKLLE